MKKLALALLVATLMVPVVSMSVQPVKTETTTTVVAGKSFKVKMKKAADVYGGASYSSAIIGVVNKGQKVTYLGTITNNFAKIKVGNIVGYVSVDAIDAKGW